MRMLTNKDNVYSKAEKKQKMYYPRYHTMHCYQSVQCQCLARCMKETVLTAVIKQHDRAGEVLY